MSESWLLIPILFRSANEIQAFGNNMLNAPLLLVHPTVEAVAKSVSERTGSTATPAQVLYVAHTVTPVANQITS
jgi:hypothetical protein